MKDAQRDYSSVIIPEHQASHLVVGKNSSASELFVCITI